MVTQCYNERAVGCFARGTLGRKSQSHTPRQSSHDGAHHLRRRLGTIVFLRFPRTSFSSSIIGCTAITWWARLMVLWGRRYIPAGKARLPVARIPVVAVGIAAGSRYVPLHTQPDRPDRYRWQHPPKGCPFGYRSPHLSMRPKGRHHLQSPWFR